MKLFFYPTIIFAVLVACSAPDNETHQGKSNSAIYSGGDIITMRGEEPEYVEAMVATDGKIAFVGSLAEAEENYTDARKVNLEGKTMLPGFFDGHLHFSALGGQAVVANLLAEPDGVVNDIPALLTQLREWHEANGTDKTNGWIVGMGFDDAVLAEGRFPTKADLDQVSTEIPICVIHISGHFAAMNSKGLEMSGITAETPNPEGGIIRRVAGSNEPNGVLEELAAIPLFFPILTPKDTETSDYYLDQAQKSAASFGYTTVQEGRAMKGTHEQLVSYAERDKFYLDVVSYIDYSAADVIDSEWYGPTYNNGYRIGGMKLTLDGSPQGRTAWRTEPYLIPPEGAGNDYAGYPAIPQDSVVQKIVNRAFENDWQLLTHANGDAAVDQLLRCMRPAIDNYGNDNRRHVLIHGQYIRLDQMDSLAAMDIIPSLFPMHTFYWGDWHAQLIGEEKAQNISPIKTAIELGMKPTSHTDAPVALPNLMVVLWTTVNRETRSGKTLGPDQRLTPYEALKTITVWGARQHFEEDTKGTLEAGKLADLVILDKNPLKIDPSELLNIQVIETIKEGNTIYQRD